MNKNVLGGIAALFALGAIFYFAQSQAPAPAPVVVHSAPVAVKPPVKPIPKPEAPKVEPKKVPGPKVTYYRVEQDGKAGPAVECSSVHPFADGKSPAELATLAKQYGVTESDLKRYFICTN